MINVHDIVNRHIELGKVLTKARVEHGNAPHGFVDGDGDMLKGFHDEVPFDLRVKG